MRSLSVLCCLLTVMLSLGAEINVEGTEGGEVSFKCSHKLAHNNKKYFCTDPCKTIEDILVDVSPGETATSGRITLVDTEDGAFTVKITQLLLSDAHVYWCAVIRSISNTYTSVNLTVHKAFKTTVSPIVSSAWFPTVSNSTQLTTRMGTNATGNLLEVINSTTPTASALGTTSLTRYDPVLFAAAGTAAALIIFSLAMYARKRREMSKPLLLFCLDNKEPRSEATECRFNDKGPKSDISIIANHLQLHPTTAPVSLPVYENLPFSSGSRNLPAEEPSIDDADHRIYITPLPSAAAEINSVSQSVSTEPPSRSLWFGLDVSRINHV
ncbi:CMRF35-like molecule 5 [Poeciliopsis prolifica]|uniref:CMRF35-like molecule 5 n=1 Tax=Poeciliopsis prolifica TaxID=188132 RepID=UPI0024130E4C|nr:CMRF35-like molecule 5 [Poeciliopsis prolifica]